MTPTPPAADELLDVLIVGAGLSGIGAARHLTRHCPQERWAIVEARDAIGGTWDLFRYPGIRSDSDMYTLGYAFKPWRGAKAIADGPSILRYIRETAEEADITPRIRFGHKVTHADWDSTAACWTITLRRSGSDKAVTLRTRLLYLCSGYYRYEQGHRPVFDGEEQYRGTLVHAQFWPDQLNTQGRRIVVIGSGATAVTLVPELAARGATHVTMLQRSPSYVVTRPSQDRIAQALQRVLPLRAAHALARWKNVLVGRYYFHLARRYPQQSRQRIVQMAAQQLPAGYDVARHFTPRYMPWDQRVCVVPDGDLFREISAGRVSVETAGITAFSATGVQLDDGRELPADIVVLATGLQLNVLGDIAVRVDGQPLQVGRTLSYKGLMLADVPNLVVTFGYTNASWTLKADLTATWVCRLLRHMRKRGLAVAVPRGDATQATHPFLPFSSGYVQRAAGTLPLQGDKAPWQVHQNYIADLFEIKWARLDDGVLQFSPASQPARANTEARA